MLRLAKQKLVRKDIIKKVNEIEAVLLKKSKQKKYRPLVSNSWDHWCWKAKVEPIKDINGNPIMKQKPGSNLFYYVYNKLAITKIIDARKMRRLEE